MCHSVVPHFEGQRLRLPLLAVMVAAFVVVNNDILHWIALGVFAPLAKANLSMACIAALLYLLFLGHFFQPDRQSVFFHCRNGCVELPLGGSVTLAPQSQSLKNLISNNGRNMIEPRVRIYALSTCVHCTALRDMLYRHDISFEITDIDLLPREERQQFLKDIAAYNPQKTFPIIIVNNKAIVGYRKDLIKQELGIA